MKPVMLGPNQPARFYQGGARIAAFWGGAQQDGGRPEDWVASTTTLFGEPTAWLAYYARNLDEFPDLAGWPRPPEAVADDIGRSLTSSPRRRCFVDWLDRRSAALVRLEPGHEHPGVPRQPDATRPHQPPLGL